MAVGLNLCCSLWMHECINANQQFWNYLVLARSLGLCFFLRFSLSPHFAFCPWIISTAIPYKELTMFWIATTICLLCLSSHFSLDRLWLTHILSQTTVWFSSCSYGLIWSLPCLVLYDFLFVVQNVYKAY